MSRRIVATVEEALADLGSKRSRPPWMSSDTVLPFSSLSPDEFEVICFLLLKSEYSESKVYYYGKTGDGGRDIVIRNDKATVYFQCKHYSANVGIGDVRVELAKLYANVHLGRLPEKPTELCFVVSSDFTAPAHDLLDSQSEWINISAAALEFHLDAKPTPDMLRFARDWWPTIDRMNGAELSARILRFPDLCNQFFSLTKVVVGDLQDVMPKFTSIDSQLREIRATLNMDDSALPAGLARVMSEMEAKHPGLKFKTSIAASGDTHFSISSLAEDGIPIATMSFPDTPSGKVGMEKFKALLEKGIAAEFATDEVIWSPVVRNPFVTSDAKTQSLTIIPNIAPERFPVSIFAGKEGTQRQVIGLTHAKVVRMGTKEMEISLSGGQLGGTLSLIVEFSPTLGKGIQFSVDLPAVLIGHCVKTLEFAVALSDQETMEVRSIEHDLPLFGFIPGPELRSSSTMYKKTIDLARKIWRLSNHFSLPLRYPDTLNQDELDEINLAYSALKTGRVAVSHDGKPIRLELTKSLLAVAVPLWIEQKPFFFHLSKVDESLEFCGNTVSFGPRSIDIEGAFPMISLHDLKEDAAKLEDGNTMIVEVSASRIIHNFEKLIEELDGHQPRGRLRE